MATAQQIQRIAVIGATGRLAVPVVEALVKAGFAVRALVRDEAKAKKLLPAAVELVRADLHQADTLAAGLQGQDAVYINLTTETARLDLPWYQEREGVQAIIEAARKTGVRHMYKIGAAWTPEMKIAPALIQQDGHRLIEQSGIPYTIFHPTMFMDNIEFQLKENHTIEWIGNTRHGKFWWIAADDYAQQVLAAINNPTAHNRHYPMLGPECLTAQEVFDRFKAVYNPSLKVKSAPLFVIKLLGFVNAQMRFLGQLYGAFAMVKEEPFTAQETWQDLGRPSVTVEEYARRFKEKVPPPRA